jgi:pilus assembly protein Flp/PilA
MKNFIQTLFRANDRGASAVEYGILVAAIAAVVIVAVFALGGQVNGKFVQTCSALKNSGTAAAAATAC